MIPRVEHIGQPAQSSWPRRARRWLTDLFGSDYVRLLERDLLQARLERDRARNDADMYQQRLVEVLASVKGVPLRPMIPQDQVPVKKTPLPPTNWQAIQAQAIAENARAEEEEAKAATKPKENSSWHSKRKMANRSATGSR